MKTGPFKMKGKSPMMKALIGKQGNLPAELKAKILASPATMKKESMAPMKKESMAKMKKAPAKMKKESMAKMNKKSMAKKAMNTDSRDTIKKILEPGFVKLNRVLKNDKETTSTKKTTNTKSKIDLAPKPKKDQEFDKNKGTGKNLIVKKPKATPTKPSKKRVTFAEAYKKRDMKTYGNQTLAEYTKEAKRQSASKTAGKGYDAPKSQMKGSVIGPKTKGGDATPKKEVKTTKTNTKANPKVKVKKQKTVKEARKAVKIARITSGRRSAEVKAAKVERKDAKKNAKATRKATKASEKLAKRGVRKTKKAVKKGIRQGKRLVKKITRETFS